MSTADDELAIARVIQAYFVALDEGEYDRLDDVFTADAEVRYSLGAAPGPPMPYRQMVARMRDFNAAFAATQHLASAPFIELDGDRAGARTSLRALHVQRGSGASTWVVHGVYRDELVRSADGWRISRRDFRALHVEGDLETTDEHG